MMPKILERCVRQLKAKGKEESTAYAICTKTQQKAGNLKKGTRTATSKGTKRGNMTPAARAKDRQAKYRGGSPSSYKYKRSNNTAVKKSGSKKPRR